MADTVEDFQRLKQEFVGLRARLITLTGSSPSALEPPTQRHYETLDPDVQRVLMEQLRSANAGMRARLEALAADDPAARSDDIASVGLGVVGIAVLIVGALAVALVLALTG